MLLAIVLIALVISGIGPLERGTWWLEVFPVLIGVPDPLATARRFPLTPLVVQAARVHALILILGGHYTYARGAARVLGAGRCSASRATTTTGSATSRRASCPRSSPARSCCAPRRCGRGGWLFFLVTAICLAISASYEFIEWWAALLGGAAADAFLGTQGDVWDTQWDMFLALCRGASPRRSCWRAPARPAALRNRPRSWYADRSMNPVKLELAALVALVLFVPASAQDWFGAPRQFMTTDPVRLVIDVDADGDLDLVRVTPRGRRRRRVHRDGEPRERRLHRRAAGTVSRSGVGLVVAGGDVTGDGRPDLLFATTQTYAAGSGFLVYPGSPSGTFGAPTHKSIPGAVVKALHLADVTRRRRARRRGLPRQCDSGNVQLAPVARRRSVRDMARRDDPRRAAQRDPRVVGPRHERRRDHRRGDRGNRGPDLLPDDRKRVRDRTDAPHRDDGGSGRLRRRRPRRRWRRGHPVFGSDAEPDRFRRVEREPREDHEPGRRHVVGPGPADLPGPDPVLHERRQASRRTLGQRRAAGRRADDAAADPDLGDRWPRSGSSREAPPAVLRSDSRILAWEVDPAGVGIFDVSGDGIPDFVGGFEIMFGVGGMTSPFGQLAGGVATCNAPGLGRRRRPRLRIEHRASRSLLRERRSRRLRAGPARASAASSRPVGRAVLSGRRLQRRQAPRLARRARRHLPLLRRFPSARSATIGSTPTRETARSSISAWLRSSGSRRAFQCKLSPVLDVNGDGFDDIVAQNTVWYSNGAGTLTPGTVSYPGSAPGRRRGRRHRLGRRHPRLELGVSDRERVVAPEHRGRRLHLDADRHRRPRPSPTGGSRTWTTTATSTCCSATGPCSSRPGPPCT